MRAMSRLAWARELKLESKQMNLPVFESRLAWARELKFPALFNLCYVVVSRLAWARELKFANAFDTIQDKRRALRGRVS